MNENKLVPVPIWILKHKVEMDFQEYMFFHDPEECNETIEDTDEFPMYDSTTQVLEILKENGVEFDRTTGLWKE